MKCHYCGTQLPDDLQFCFYCGTKQVPPQQPAEEAPAPDWFDLRDRIEEEPPVEARPEPQPVYREAPQPAPVYEAVPARQFAPAQPAGATPKAPRLQLPVKRSLTKMFFLGLLTLGIYPTVIWSRIATELNITASRHDGERTMPYFAMLALAPLTLGIYALVWNHNFCRRVGQELRRRKLDFTFDVSDYWLWGILGTLIIAGPFVYTFKLMRAINQINGDYNVNG